jgi:hypothetical protein
MVVELIDVPTRTDEQLIAAGRKLLVKLEIAQLELGRLALEFAPIGEPGIKTGAYDRVRRYAEEIGLDEVNVRNYRTVAHGWQGIDTEGFGFSLLKGCMSIGDKDGFLEALRENTPAPTRSGRWTVAAAIQFARDNGFWSHLTSRRDAVQGLIASVKRACKGLSLVAEYELDEPEREALAQALYDLALELATAREMVRPKGTK